MEFHLTTDSHDIVKKEKQNSKKEN